MTLKNDPNTTYEIEYNQKLGNNKTHIKTHIDPLMIFYRLTKFTFTVM